MRPHETLKAARDNLILCLAMTSQFDTYDSIAQRMTRRGHAEAVLHTVEKANQLMQALDEMLVASKEAEQLIDSLENAKHRAVLRLVYLCGYKLNQTAEKVNYTYRWTKVIHDEAIRELERRYDNESGTADH